MQLQEAGSEEPQARALVTFAEGLSDTLATRDGLDAAVLTLDAKIDRVDANLGARIDRVDADLGARIDRVEAKMDAEFSTLRGEMAVLKRDLML